MNTETATPHVIDVDVTTFERDVIDASSERLVVVDFWSPQCGPCRVLTPILEKLAAEYGGRFVLAKVNIDRNPEIAAQVQGVPFVLGFVEGRPIDQFAGAQPEPMVREWLDRLLPSPADELVNAGLELEATDPRAAEEKFREATGLVPDDDAIRIHLARVIVSQQRYDEAEAIIGELAKRGYLEPEAEQIKSQLELRHAAEEAGEVEEARAAVEANPDDLSLRLTLADALAGNGRHRDALELLLDVVKADRDGVGQQAKDTMLRLFDTLGSASELVGDYRRQLATWLY